MKNMNENATEILARRNYAIMIRKEEMGSANSLSRGMAAAMMKNVQALGFTFNKELLCAIAQMPAAGIEELYKTLLPVLREMVGADKEYFPFYPNFPRQVAEADDLELIVNALVHYMTLGHLIPAYEKEERFPLIGEYGFKELRLARDGELMEIFTNLLESSVPLSEQDKKDVTWFMENTEYTSYIPNEIPMKETKAFIGALLLKEGNAETLKTLYKTATDVLRLIAGVSDGDVSLDRPVKVRKMRRAERRIFMDLLAGCGNLTEDMFRYKGLWKTAGEVIHPGEFKNTRYNTVRDAFAALRSENKPETFASITEAHIGSGRTMDAAKHLAARPGEFARNLDRLLLLDKDHGFSQAYILRMFEEVADRVSTRVLWQAAAHFEHRGEHEFRTVVPAGNEGKTRLIDARPALSGEICAAAVRICKDAIRRQYAGLPALGKVYIGEEFRQFAAPFSHRSESSSLRQMARGSRIRLVEDTKVVRPFIWWTNCEDGCRVDIDLSAVYLDENFRCTGEVTYYNLRDRQGSEWATLHSGDITNGGDFGSKGAAEFIDINLDVVSRRESTRYVVMQVNMYSGPSFSNVPCGFGWMERKDAETGELFEPGTVENRMELCSNSKMAIPALIDLETREIIWADITATSRSDLGGNNVASNVVGTQASVYAAANWEKPSLYDILLLHAKARGEVVSDMHEADMVFSASYSPAAPVAGGDAETGKKQPEVHDAYNLAYYQALI